MKKVKMIFILSCIFLKLFYNKEKGGLHLVIDFQLKDKDDVQKLNKIAQGHSFDV
jgi:hypothetical protein